MGSSDLRLLFVVPVFNDWPVLSELLTAIDAIVAEHQLNAEVLVVDDGSHSACETALQVPETQAIHRLRVLELQRNLGHQRALAIAFAFAHEHANGATLVVLDGDGEDDPADVPRLLDRFRADGGAKVVFAARRKRSESLLFQGCYRVYQMLHRALTGHGIRVGNFSVVPPRAVARLAVTSETWSHYAAAVLATGIARVEVPTDRAQRLGGRSRMGFTSLVVHGLSALSVYSHRIGVRLLLAVGALLAVSGVAIVGLSVADHSVSLASGPLAAILLFLWLSLLLQAMAAATLFVFVLLSGRRSASVLPARDYGLFVHGLVEWDASGPRRVPFGG